MERLLWSSYDLTVGYRDGNFFRRIRTYMGYTPALSRYIDGVAWGLTGISEIPYWVGRVLRSRGGAAFFMVFLFASICLASMASFPSYALRDGLGLNLAWRDGDVLPPGAVSIVDVTVTNRFDEDVTLRFVGVRFDWMDEGVYLYGGGSEEPHMLDPGGSVTFGVGFNVPEGVEPGPHRVYLALVYEVEGEEYREVVQVEPPFNVIEVVTVTFTETFVTTIYGQPSEAAPPHRRPLWALIGVAVAGGLALILFLAYRRGESKGAAG